MKHSALRSTVRQLDRRITAKQVTLVATRDNNLANLRRVPPLLRLSAGALAGFLAGRLGAWKSLRLARNGYSLYTSIRAFPAPAPPPEVP